MDERLGRKQKKDSLMEFVDKRTVDFLDDNDLIQPPVREPGKLPGWSNNGLMYSSEVLVKIQDSDQPRNVLEDRLNSGIDKCEVKPGAFYRHSNMSGGHQSFDDLIAVAATDAQRASRILKFIRRRFGFYYILPNPNPYGKGWWNYWGQIFLYRNPVFMAHLQICCGETPFEWELDMLRAELTNNQSNHDSWRKSYFYCRAARSIPELANECATWSINLESEYPGGIGQVRGDYFQNHNHPSAWTSIGDFGKMVLPSITDDD